MRRHVGARSFGLVALASLLALAPPLGRADAEPSGRSYSPHVGETFPRQLFWGDTHVHSSWSVDAGNMGNTLLGPTEAFRFARGEEVRAHNGMRVRLRRPLDFLVLSDHAEYLGVMPRLDAGDALARSTETGERWYRLRKQEKMGEVFREFGASMLSGQDVLGNEPLRAEIWRDVVANAERFDAPGHFTAFIGYEWTSSSGGDNLHRNVIFRDGPDKAGQVVPFSSLDSFDPEDLWRALADYEAKTGGRVMAIPHNSNLSGGQMFATETFSGAPLTRDYAERRARFERLVEVTQYKGDSETHPVLSPDDEYADYETWEVNVAGRATDRATLAHAYVRPALGLGLDLAARLGVNPFKMGMIGSTDAHTGLATAEEDNFFGKFSRAEPARDRWNVGFWPEGRSEVQYQEWRMAASGYAAVWAHANTRAALFDAMARRETYATTGPRMVVRFFGGWSFEPGDAHEPDLAAIGYGRGVPMGADLPPQPGHASAPSFLVAVMRDPEGANLDRVQIVKGWRDADGAVHERVYDVAVSGGRAIGEDGRARESVGSTIDLEKARYTNAIGAAQLVAVWRDPRFDPAERAFYYLRALEIPKPRWTAYDARRLGAKPHYKVPMVTRDRAYTSPIWYAPPAGG